MKIIDELEFNSVYEDQEYAKLMVTNLQYKNEQAQDFDIFYERN